MKEKLTQQYDSLYSSAECIYGNKPNEGVEKVVEILEEGRILDIGGGEGRDSLYLAEHGFDMTVYDISAIGIDKLNDKAADRGLEIKTIVKDVVEEGIEGDYECVIISFMLHHIPDGDAQCVIKDAKGHTVEGGLNIISTFTANGELAERNSVSGRFYPTKETMLRLYEDWEIEDVTVSEVLSQARTKDGERMKNEMITFVAKRPE